MKVFLTGSIRSGTTWLFSLLQTKISPSFLERFDLFDLELRKKSLLQHDQFVFKINEDIRDLEKLHTYFPNAKVIVLLRHPIEVLHSIYKPNKQSVPYRPFNDIREKWSYPNDLSYLSAVIRRFESYYPTSTLNLIRRAPSWLKVMKYEDYLKNFDSCIQELYSFLEIINTPANGLLGPQKTPNQSIRISNFTNEDQGMINESRVPEITKQLGYLMDS